MSCRASRSSRDGERGAATVWTLALVALLLLCGLATAMVAAVALARQRVATAADVAALAAAQADVDPCSGADRAARANGAVLIECILDGSDVIVTLSRPMPDMVSRLVGMLGGSVRDLTASARAGPP